MAVPRSPSAWPGRAPRSRPRPARRTGADGDADAADVVAPPPGTPAAVTVEDDGAVRRLVLTGDMDLAAAAACRDAMLGPVEGRGRLEIDLRAVGYLASAGVGLVLEVLQAARRAGADTDVLTAPDSAPARVLAMALPTEA